MKPVALDLFDRMTEAIGPTAMLRVFVTHRNKKKKTPFY